MSRRSSLAVAAVGASVVGLATRVFPLSWSPYPTTLDGFVHARVGRGILQIGRVAITGLRADQLIEPIMLAIVAVITGVKPVILAQPLYSIIGSVTILIAIGFVGRLGRHRHWSRTQIKAIAALVGLTLALEGIFVRQTGTPDSDAFTLVLVPLATLAFYLGIREDRWAWLVIAILVLCVLPLTHTFATLIAALGVTTVAISLLLTVDDRRRVGFAVGTVFGFWVYFYSYYQVAPILSLSVPYVDRISAHPGLFLAWLIVLVLGVLWFQRTTTRWQRLAFIIPLLLFYLVLLVNSWTTVYPGTVRTPQQILLLALPLAVPTFIAGLAAPILSNRHSISVVILALLAAPIVQILFSLTAALTPEFFGTVMRAQTFAHLSAAIVAAYGVVLLPRFSDGVPGFSNHGAILRTGMACLLLVPVIWSLPIAYVDLDTGAYPRGTVPAEFEAASFTYHHIDGSWTSDHKQTTLTGNYFGSTGGISATITWLSGGSRPSCPLVSKQSWTDAGAHLFPTAPIAVPEGRYAATLAQRNLVYRSADTDPIAITVPRNSTQNGC